MDERTSTYIFIDGGYLRRQHADATKEWFGGEAVISFPLVIERLKTLSGAMGFIIIDNPDRIPDVRSFYYDCFDEERKTTETESEYKVRLEEENARLQDIRRVEECHIRLGALKGTKRRQQKEVDVLIAVDMMSHAARRNMTKAVLVAGDQDLRPAVEALVQFGIIVQIIAAERHFSKELTWAASTFTKLTFEDFYQWTSTSLQAKYPKPQSGDFEPSTANSKAIRKGSLKGNRCRLFKSESGYYVYFDRFNWNTFGYVGESPMHFRHHDLDRLELYLQLNFGSVLWDAS